MPELWTLVAGLFLAHRIEAVVADSEMTAFDFSSAWCVRDFVFDGTGYLFAAGLLRAGLALGCVECQDTFVRVVLPSFGLP